MCKHRFFLVILLIPTGLLQAGRDVDDHQIIDKAGCKHFYIERFPELKTAGRGVIQINTINSSCTGFIIATPLTFSRKCDAEEKDDFVYFLTAAHIIDRDKNLTIEQHEIDDFERNAYVVLNYERRVPPWSIKKKHPIYVDWYNRLYRIFDDDIVLCHLVVPEETLIKLNPFFFSIVDGRGTENMTIHHGGGDFKSVTKDFETIKYQPRMPIDMLVVTPGTKGGFEGGMSGAPVFNSSNPFGIISMQFASRVPSNTVACADTGLALALDRYRSMIYKELRWGLLSGNNAAGLSSQSKNIMYGYPYGPNVLETDVYENYNETKASKTRVDIDPFVYVYRSQLGIRAPQIGYSLMGIGTQHQLRIQDHSTVRMDTRHLSLPFLSIAPPYPPGNKGWDNSGLYIDACRVDPIEHWEVNQNAEMSLNVMDGDLEIGQPVSYPEGYSALYFYPASRITLQAPNVIFNHSVSASGWLQPWDETGFLEIISDDGILLNPMENVVFNFHIASNVVFSSMVLAINNVQLIQHISSWRADAKQITAEKMHMYRDVHQDWRPGDGVVWVSESTSLQTCTIEESVSPLVFDAKNMSVYDSQFMFSGTGNGWIHSTSAQIQQSAFQYVDGNGNQVEWSIGGMNNYSRINVCINVPNSPRRPYAGIPEAWQGAKGEVETSLRSAVSASTNPGPAMHIRAESLQLQNNRLTAQNGEISIQAGHISIDSQTSIQAVDGGKISIGALSDRELLVHNRTFKNSIRGIAKTTTAIDTKRAKIDTTGPGPLAAKIKTAESGQLAKCPEEFVFSVFPNPFNNQTKIQYATPEQSHVDIKIYDIRGRLADSLPQGQVSAGVHTLTWRASRHASGIYFAVCHILTGD